MSYGHTPPGGIPQAIWDDAIDLWLNLSTADSDDIKTIADRLLAVTNPGALSVMLANSDTVCRDLGFDQIDQISKVIVAHLHGGTKE